MLDEPQQPDLSVFVCMAVGCSQLGWWAGPARCDSGTGIQVCCYEDSKLLKLFTDIVRMLYDNDILAEDTIQWWAKKVIPSTPA